MAVFTVLADAELAAVAAAFSLGAVRGHRTIAAGTINSNFALSTERGEYFLRVNEGKAELDVAWEARLVGAFAAAGVPTPPPLVAADGRPYAAVAGHAGKWASVFPWRDGGHFGADQVDADEAYQLGEALARMHVIGLGLPASWRRTSIYDHDHLVARLARIADHPDPELAHALAVISDELAAGSAARELRARATTGIIHGDLFRDNVMWTRTGHSCGEISAILDFEQASGGSLAYDLAVCINDWCWNPRAAAPRLSLAKALIEGYESVRRLTEGDRAALPIELRASAARFTLTRITDVYLARVDNPEKDFRAFLARLDAWRSPALGQAAASL